MAKRVYKSCPVRGCRGHRGPTEVMCPSCWFKVPNGLRSEIWQHYRSQPGSEKHLRAIRAAIVHVNKLGDEVLSA